MYPFVLWFNTYVKYLSFFTLYNYFTYLCTRIKMMRKIFTVFIVVFTLISFSDKGKDIASSFDKVEQIEVSKIFDFSKAIETQSIYSFNVHNQKNNQVLSLNKLIIKGKYTIKKYFSTQQFLSKRLIFFPIIFQKIDIIYPFHYFF